MTITLTCLALAAYMEAREHYRTPDAMAAVVAVVQNRVDDPRYPNTACEVIAQPGQFPWYTSAKAPATNGAPDEWAWDMAQAVALHEMSGYGLDITSTHFHTVGKPQYWVDAYQLDGAIGGNVFYTNDTRYP